MKKIKLLLMPVICLSLILSGCRDDKKKSNNNADSTPTPETSETTPDTSSDSDEWSFIVG